jgi:hypothetical protein
VKRVIHFLAPRGGGPAIQACRPGAFREHHGQSLTQVGALRSLNADFRGGVTCLIDTQLVINVY